jgi:hypothetical protein
LGKILVASGEGHKTKETDAIPVNQLVDIVKLSSGTLLSREAKNSRGVSGMHMRTRRVISKKRLRLGNFSLVRGKRTTGSQD